VEMMHLVTKLFGPPREIDACAHFPNHLYRWTIFGNSRLEVFLDRFVGDDWSGDPDAYPRKFISIGLAESATHAPQKLIASQDRAGWMLLIGKLSRTGVNRENELKR
jgi:hypothetical protein